MPSSQALDSDRYDVAVIPLRNEARHRTTVSAFNDSIPQTDADGNTSAQDVTELSQSGRQWSTAGEERTDLQSRVIPELVESIEKEDASSSARPRGELSSFAGAYPSASSAIRIADLMRLVNRKHQKYLPQQAK